MSTRVERFLESAAVADAPSISTGAYVSWKASKGSAVGKVVSVHTNSRVPGIMHNVEGTKIRPAVRIRLYAKQGKGYVPTETFVGLHTDGLSSIDPLPEVATEAVAGSFDDLRERVEKAIAERAEGYGGVDCTCWITDMGVDWAVYWVRDELYMISYTASDSGIELGDPIEVVRKTTYEPTGSQAEPEPEPETAPEATEDTSSGLPESEGMGMAESVHVTTGRLLGAKGIDSAGGRIFEVEVIQFGESKNGRRYPARVMQEATSLYEGAKAYDHHRTDAELRSSTVSGLVGSFRSPRATESAIVADLHLLPSASHVAEAFDMSLENQAGGLPPLIGISHDVLAESRVVVEGGRKLVEATKIVAVNSVDVVADPAAGGKAVRMVAGGIDTDPTSNKENTLNLKQLLALLRVTESAKRPALLAEHSQVLTGAGLSADDALRMAEAVEPPAQTERITEATIGRTSAMGRLLVQTAVTEAKLDARLVESVLLDLPEQFTEAELSGKVEAYKRIAEGLERAGLAPSVPDVKVTQDAFDAKVIKLDKMMEGDYRAGYRSLKEAYIDITGGAPRWSDSDEFNRTILAESVQFQNGKRLTESVESSTWGNILGDSITRRMGAEYAQPSLNTWRPLVSSIVPVSDFRTQRLERMGGYGTLPAVNQGAPYQPLATPGNDTEVTYAVTKRGGTEDLTLETIANDDLRAVQRIPQKLGMAAAQTLYRFVFDFFNTNPNIFDGSALFVAGHNNTASTALSGANLSTARKNMRKQAAYGDTSNILSIVPRYLVVPPDLEELAYQLATSAVALPSGAPVGAASNIPNMHQGIVPIVVDYFSASSTTAWYLVADPSMVPTIELGFYQGQQDPQLFVQSDPTVGSAFNADKITYKIRHIYSGAVVDFRGMYRGNS